MQSFTVDDILQIQLSGDVNQAEYLYLQGLQQNPDDWVILFHLSILYQEQEKYPLAAMLLEQALRIQPNKFEICSNLGIIYRLQDQHERAKKYLELGMELSDGKDPDVYVNLGSLYVNEGNPEKGEHILRDGLALDKNNELIRWNLSLCLLELGKWSEAWEHYKYGKIPNVQRMPQGADEEKFVPRVTRAERQRRWIAFPEWEKEKATVILYGEQGLGDEIMFLSMLPDVLKDADKVILECHPRLEKMINRCYPMVQTSPTRKMQYCPSAMEFDYHRALGDLGGLYRNSAKSFPGTAYLQADQDLVQMYRERLEQLGPGPYYGLGWRGGYNKTKKKLRSLKLNDFKPILDEPGIFISMQYDKGADIEVSTFCHETGYKIHHWPEVVREDDYDHTAALAMALDQIICCNTTLVHLCGALGRSCWSLTPKRPAWRYQLKGPMPWYKSVTLLRQDDDNDWSAPVNQAIELMRGDTQCKQSPQSI